MHYDEKLTRRCMAGPNALYLTEELTASMALKPGMQVLDLGCGRGLSSVFLAREFGVQVFAADKQVHASETYEMLKDIGLEKQVYPIQADAEQLPFQPESFDALVCVNAYHNFGMEPGFFREKLAPLLRPGAQAGIVVPATADAFMAADDPQERERPAFWSMANWRRWFEREMEIELCQTLTCTQRAWRDWLAVSSSLDSADDLQAKLSPKLALVKLVGQAK